HRLSDGTITIRAVVRRRRVVAVSTAVGCPIIPYSGPGSCTIRQTRRRARAIGPLRPVRRPPARSWWRGAGGCPGAAAGTAGRTAAGGPHRGLPDGPAGLAGAGPDRRSARVQAHRPGPAPARRRGRPDLPDRGGRGLGPALAPGRAAVGAGPATPRPARLTAQLPRLGAAVGQHLGRP